MKKALAITVIAGFGLAACDDSSQGSNTGVASLGAFFAKAFNQSPNDEPLLLEDRTLDRTPRKEPFDV